MAHTQPDARRPVVVTPSQLAEPPEQQTPSIRRQEAFVEDDRWVGYVTTTPGDWSGWHHHGATDTYLYVLAGELEFEFGPDRQTVTFSTGDFAHMPAGVVHRERTLPGLPGEVVLVRVGRGPTVVNVDEPPSAR
jgi:quercetin dioxygenase-like cupin family protein